MKYSHPVARPTERSKAVVGAASIIRCVSVGAIMSITRKQEVVDARWAAFWVLKHECKYGLAKIGRVMGRDRSSARYALKHMNERQIELAIMVKERLVHTRPEIFRPYREQPAQEMRVTT
jgi:chromosomal replication initiation ATPase DnaA